MSRNASPRTKTKTSGALSRIASLKSFANAVSPVTPAWTPSSAPTVFGTTSFLSVASASNDSESLPVPAIGSSTRATVPDGVHVGRDRLVRGARRDRPAPELVDRRLDALVDRACLDDDDRGLLLARESVLQPVVGLHDGEILR